MTYWGSQIPLIAFNEEECRVMHLACIAPHNAHLIAEVQKIRPGFYADKLIGGFFKDLTGVKLGIRSVELLPLLLAIAKNEIRHFDVTPPQRGALIISPQDRWRILSSVVRKLLAAQETRKKELH